MATDKIVINAGANIGANSAENDDLFLFESYVENPIAAHLVDNDTHRNFIIGRTGAGKTAIIRMIEKNSERPIYIDVYDMAMTYVANSDIFTFLDSMDAPLHLFFQYLWKHVLLTTFIQSFFQVEDEKQSRNLADKVALHFRKDKRKERALKYLEDWSGRFWISVDETVRELSEKLEEKVSADLGAEVEKFTARAGYSSTLSKDKRLQIDRRLKQIISPQQLAEISDVINMLSEFVDSQKYVKNAVILIDQLDENWVDESVRFKLIRGLIEAVRVFRTVHRCRVYCAIRIDVYERVVQETADIGFQRDKYEDYFARLKWRENQLEEIVNKRVGLLFRRQYTGRTVSFGDIFSHNVGTVSPFSYMIKRTLLRPRDIISFVNVCLELAVDTKQVTGQNVREGEGVYSSKQRDALIAEWKAALPSLDAALTLLARRHHVFEASELLNGNQWDDFVMAACAIPRSPWDPICKVAIASINSAGAVSEGRLLAVTLSELYRTAAIGLKTPSSARYLWSHMDAPVLAPALIDKETKVQIHPMLHRALIVDARDAGR